MNDRPGGGAGRLPARFPLNNTNNSFLNIARLTSFAPTLPLHMNTRNMLSPLVLHSKPQNTPTTISDDRSPPPPVDEDLMPSYVDTRTQVELVAVMQSIIGPSTSVEELTALLLGAGHNVQIALNHWAQRQESRGSSGSTSPSLDEVSPLERVISEVGEEIECRLCMAYFDNPVSLACLHTFCSSCVEKIANERSVTCPTCQVDTPLDSGVQGLAQNHYLSNIVDMIKHAPMRKCAGCQKTSISAFCKNCRQFLCTECNLRIHAEPSNARHRVRRFGQDKRSPLKKRIELEACEPMFNEWLDSLWMTPFMFKQSINLEKFRLLYLPYHFFEVSATVHCLYEYQTDHHSPGVRVKWQHTAESSQQNVDFFAPAYGMDRLPGRHFFDHLDPRSITECEASLGEATDIHPFITTPVEAWENNWKEKLNAEQEDRCSKEHGRIRNFRMTCHIHQKSSRRVFFPVYMCRYRYLGVYYHFAINAATGAVHGERPHSTLKPMLTGLSILQCLALVHRVIVNKP